MGMGKGKGKGMEAGDGSLGMGKGPATTAPDGVSKAESDVSPLLPLREFKTNGVLQKECRGHGHGEGGGSPGLARNGARRGWGVLQSEFRRRT